MIRWRINPLIQGKEVAVKGRLVRTARLRHEWCDFLDDPCAAAAELKAKRHADLFTFVTDIGDSRSHPFHRESASIAVLPVESYDAWWEVIGKKKRNQIRKAQKSGVELRVAALDHEFARGVEALYNECPVRQGRRFCHYHQSASEIEDELSSFIDRSLLVGAYVNGRMAGFMKLYRAEHALRVVHILALLCERDKCVMDALIGKAVELCVQLHHDFLHYGSWTDSGIGAFRMKHGFERMEVPRYFAPLNWRGQLILSLNLHHPLRERLPKHMVETLVGLRARWNSLRLPKELVDA